MKIEFLIYYLLFINRKHFFEPKSCVNRFDVTLHMRIIPLNHIHLTLKTTKQFQWKITNFFIKKPRQTNSHVPVTINYTPSYVKIAYHHHIVKVGGFLDGVYIFETPSITRVDDLVQAYLQSASPIS